MNKREIKKILKSYGLTFMDIDSFLSKRTYETFTEYKNEISVNVGKELSFSLNLKKTKSNDWFSYSSIGANGYELQMSLDRCFEILKKYLDCELSEKQIVEYITF